MTQKPQSLLNYLNENPPDLANRAYLKSLGLSTSHVDFGAPHHSEGKEKILTIPPPPRTKMIQSTQATRGWLSRGPGNDLADGTREIDDAAYGGQSLVAPLLWVPGILRQQGAWMSAMKETMQGPAFAIQPGVDLVDKSILPNSVKQVSLQDELAAKDALIQELERTVAKQKLLSGRLLKDMKKQSKMFSTTFERARDDERRNHKIQRTKTIHALEEKLTDLRDDMRTLKKATASRVRKTYQQDNFLSIYSTAKLQVREEAKAIADAEQTSLRNRLSAMERQIRRDGVYKNALKTRTEIAEQAADKRWNEAESKIPALEALIHQSNMKGAHDRLLEQERMNRHRREMEKLQAQLHKEQELRRQAEDEYAKLREQFSPNGSAPRSPLQATTRKVPM